MNPCPCCSGEEYDNCCGPYLSGKQDAPTAEALMRSRYTAHTKADIDYIVATWDPNIAKSLNAAETKAWAERCEWLGLQITDKDKGMESDNSGIVEFIATYKFEGKEQQIHERSQFIKDHDRWLYVKGIPIKNKQQGRNDPCLCGSGKKYKRCCGN